MAIDITKKEDIALEFHDGYARTEVLKGVYPAGSVIVQKRTENIYEKGRVSG